MRHGLDHVVHLVRDLDAAGEVYDLIGFTVGARNVHPWGTENRIIQTPGFFIELLQVTEPEKIPPAQDGFFSFGAYNAAFLDRVGEGLSMLALQGKAPQDDKAAFDAAGFGGFDLFDFARTAHRPDGREVEVGFTLAFAVDPAAPDLAAFTCTQLKPENFWAPELQRHSNGTTGVAGVVLVADDPAAHQAFVTALAGAEVKRARDDWFIAETPRGAIDLVTRRIFSERYGVPAPGSGGLRLAGVRVLTEGSPSLRRGLAARGMLVDAITGITVVPPAAAMGAALIFERPD